MASSIQLSRVITKGPSVFVTNNHSNHTTISSGTNNGNIETGRDRYIAKKLKKKYDANKQDEIEQLPLSVENNDRFKLHI